MNLEGPTGVNQVDRYKEESSRGGTTYINGGGVEQSSMMPLTNFKDRICLHMGCLWGLFIEKARKVGRGLIFF